MNIDTILEKAQNTFIKNFTKTTFFERAIFLGWYCKKADCKFCYMSTQKNKINKEKAKRTKESLLAEVIIAKACNWKIEFLSAGYNSFQKEELIEILKKIYQLTGKKQWLNIGVLEKKDLLSFLPYIEGVNGAVECINPVVRENICPSKPLLPIEKMFRTCDKLGLKKAITVVIGVGEKKKDFELLKRFINKHKIDRVTFYSLNPQKGTIFKKSPNKYYYAWWIAKTRIEFPKLKIIAGLWKDKTDYIPLILKAGANSLTKFPAIKYFGTNEAKNFVNLTELSNRTFKSNFLRVPQKNWNNELKKIKLSNEERKKVLKNINIYISKMRKNL